MNKGMKMAVVIAAALGLTAAPAMAEQVRVGALKGPTAIGMMKMMDDAEQGAVDYSFEIAAAADVITPMLAKGEVDIAAVPANLAAVLYNNTEGQIQVLNLNTLGVLYIVETSDTVKSVEDLKGKTIYTSGKGATPEYALDYILRGNGIDPETDVTLEWKSEHAECLASLLADPEGIAMLPQPFVTTAQMKNEGIRVALDLNEEWDRLQENEEDPSGMITGVAVVRREFAKEHPEEVADFLARYEESVAWVNENVEDAAVLVGAHDIVPEPVAKAAIPHCNITFVSGEEMKEKLSGYLQVLFDQNPKAVGGTLPADDFYYGAE